MYNFDSLTLKYFVDEYKNYFTNSTLQKVQQPTRSELILHLRNNGENKKLYINIHPQYMHICFTDKIFYKIPKYPPMFCMLLRKYIENAKLTDVNLIPYERILELNFKSIGELNEERTLCLAIELMGKHSNIILYNKDSKTILGCAHNVSSEKSSLREVYGGIPYIYPPCQNKQDILKTNLESFIEDISNSIDITETINKKYYYFTKHLTNYILNSINEPSELFYKMNDITSSFNCDFFSEMYEVKAPSINDFILNYFNKNAIEYQLNLVKKEILSNIEKELKKIEKKISEKSKTDKIETYKRNADLISKYIFKLKKGDEFLLEENTKVILDTDKTPSENAQKYYILYKKSKNAKEILDKRREEALIEKKFLEEKKFYIENAKTMIELDEIENIEEDKKIKKENFVIQKISYKNYEIYLGRNGKQNDYLISKIAKSEDFWFHAKDNPSCHLILKNPNRNQTIDDDVLLFCAKTIKQNSTLKTSTKASIIYTQKKYLRKAQNRKQGLYIYENEKEIVVE